MLQICEEYAFNYKITCNATKSQLLYFSYLDKDHSYLLSFTMKDRNVIPYVSKCLVLQYTQRYIEIMLLMSLMNCMNAPTNWCQIYFTESCTVSNLFNSFCMNLYSCQTWRFNNKKH